MDTALDRRVDRALQSAGYLDQQVSGKRYIRAYRTAPSGYKLSADGPPEERVLYGGSAIRPSNLISGAK